MPRNENVLVSFGFGEFGNYGTMLVVKMDDGRPILALENWAYGETHANVTTREGVSADSLEKLGKELMQAAVKLREIESLVSK